MSSDDAVADAPVARRPQGPPALSEVDVAHEPSPRGLLGRLLLRARARPVPSFDRAWWQVQAGQALPLPTAVRAPAVLESRLRLRAVYVAVPVLHHLHRLLPDVHVEGSSVDVADHLDGDYHPDVRLIRLECHHPLDVIAFTLLHEFGHAIDHELLDDRDRVSLDHPRGVHGWRDHGLDWRHRGEEWLAESFAHWWWPDRHEAHRPAWRLPDPPLDAQVAERAFDLRVLGRRAELR